jgi:hypothetical protein
MYVGGDYMARKTFYITDEKALEKLTNEKNESRYVTNLILKDIKIQRKITEKDIMLLIRQYLNQEKALLMQSFGEV